MHEPGLSISYKIACTPSEDSDQPSNPHRLIVFGVRLLMFCRDPWLPTACPAKTLIRLRGCADGFESSLGVHAKSQGIDKHPCSLGTVVGIWKYSCHLVWCHRVPKARVQRPRLHEMPLPTSSPTEVRRHHENISILLWPPLTPLLYSKPWVYRGIYYFSYYCLKT